ncbi:MAG: ABC transporter ATP-binding protein [Eubacteriales bacterium]|nr:ABC transporter ATP-binding protein [Eubacteriales bacterium]
MSKVLEIKNLKAELFTPGKTISPISGISFDVEKGETLGLVGESGCGKSMTVLSLMRLLSPDMGRVSADFVRLDGQDISQFTEAQFCKIRGKKMSMIFQEPMTSLNPSLKIGYQIAEPLLCHDGTPIREGMVKAYELLRAVGIADPERVANSYPHNLSGGMRQRVVIAMAIICKPKVLLADEPTTALDVTIQAQLLEMMKTLQREEDMGMVLVTHDLGIVAEYCDRVVVMYCGQIVEEAATTALFALPGHPYTKGLIACIPKISDEKEFLDHIPGHVLPVAQYESSTGCRFAQRCPAATPQCRAQTPPLFQLDVGHTCRCWQHQGNAIAHE